MPAAGPFVCVRYFSKKRATRGPFVCRVLTHGYRPRPCRVGSLKPLGHVAVLVAAAIAAGCGGNGDTAHPERGELIVFDAPELAERRCGATGLLTKRVVGLPGETIEMREGRVVIDGAELEESYLQPDIAPGPAIERQVIPPGHIFVMGDNRSNSKDSRSFGPIHQSLVIGRAFVKVWPVTDLGLL